MRRLLFASFAMIIGLSVLVIAARGVALARPSEAALVLRSDACAVPCWRGIMPGKTSIIDANTLAGRDSALTGLIESTTNPDTHTRQVCWTMQEWPEWKGCAIRATGTQGPVDQILLFPMPSIRFTFGDAMAIYGEPVAIEGCTSGGTATLDIFFVDDVEVIAFMNTPQQRLDPALEVKRIVYHFPGEEPPYPFDAPSWHGFRRLVGVYC